MEGVWRRGEVWGEVEEGEVEGGVALISIFITQLLKGKSDIFYMISISKWQLQKLIEIETYSVF